jgi:hypothetical protein
MKTEARAPDHPRVPRRQRSVRAVFAGVIAAILCCGYGALAYTQHELREPEHDVIPPSVRTSPGGYRSFHFWHSGYHGGK